MAQSTQTPTPPARRDNGALEKFGENFRVAWRLLRDPREPFILKLALPIAIIAYFVWPADFMPLNLVDDLLFIPVAFQALVALSPKWLVREIRDLLRREDDGEVIHAKPSPAKDPINPDDIIDGEFIDLTKKEK